MAHAPLQFTPAPRRHARTGRIAVVALIALGALITAPGPARAGVPLGRPLAAIPAPAARPVVPASAGFAIITEAGHLEHLTHMDLKRLLSVATGIAIGNLLIEIVYPGGPLGFVGMIGGALLGDWWYRQKLWPFHPTPLHQYKPAPPRPPERKVLIQHAARPERKPLD